jgi:hypothetical protein
VANTTACGGAIMKLLELIMQYSGQVLFPANTTLGDKPVVVVPKELWDKINEIAMLETRAPKLMHIVAVIFAVLMIFLEVQIIAMNYTIRSIS